MTNLKTEIILALDVDTNEQANEILDQVGDQLTWVKIGLQSYLRMAQRSLRNALNLEKRFFLISNFMTFQIQCQKRSNLYLDFRSAC